MAKLNPADYEKFRKLREAFTILSVHDVINHNFFISLSRQLKLNQSVVY